jgi:hypothetical protein
MTNNDDENKYGAEMKDLHKEICKLLDDQKSLRTQEKVAVLWLVLTDLYNDEISFCEIADPPRAERIREAIRHQIKMFSIITQTNEMI